MNYIKEVVRKAYYYNRNKDWDTFHVIGGDEGKSKSTLMLHLLETYLECMKGQVTEQDIRYIAQDHEQFEKIIRNMKQFEPVIDDEAGDITSKREMSNLNVRLANKYKVIRGMNGYSILLTPTPFELGGYFLKHRCKGFWFVYKRGRVAFWTRESFKLMLALNQGRYLKTPWVVKPDFRDTFQKYKGILKEPYDKQKQEGMKKKQQETEKDNKSAAQIQKEKLMEITVAAKNKGYTLTELSHILGCTTRTLQRYVKEWQDNRQGVNHIPLSYGDKEVGEGCN